MKRLHFRILGKSNRLIAMIVMMMMMMSMMRTTMMTMVMMMTMRMGGGKLRIHGWVAEEFAAS